MDNLYLTVFSSDCNSKNFNVPLETLIIYFVYKHCKTTAFTLNFIIEEKDPSISPFVINVTDTNYALVPKQSAPFLTTYCAFPLAIIKNVTVVSGVCSVARQIIKNTPPNDQFRELLGFRESCLMACNESSIWTKFCEIDMVRCVKYVLTNLKQICTGRNVEIPRDLMRFEYHMSQPVRIHNVYKVAQDYAKKKGKKRENSVIDTSIPKEQLNLEHLYGEGPFITLADIVLLPLVHINYLVFGVEIFEKYLPLTSRWYYNMRSKTEVTDIKLPGSGYAYSSLREIAPNCKLSKDETITARLSLSKETTLNSPLSEVKSSQLEQRTEKLPLLTETVLNPPLSEDITLDPSLTTKTPVPPVVREIHINSKLSKSTSLTEDKNLNLSLSKEATLVCPLLPEMAPNSPLVKDATVTKLLPKNPTVTVENLENIPYQLIREIVPNVELSKNISLTEDRNLNSSISKEAAQICPLVPKMAPKTLLVKDTTVTKLLPKDRIVTIENLENIPTESLYISDPTRYKPRNRLFTKQPDIVRALQIVNSLDTSFKSDCETFGHELKINWTQIPLEANPEGGSLPESRMIRKREQLENLAKAVMKIARPNDVIVDFCSGSGHLGILLAVLLKECRIILLENKEVSVNRARERIVKLNLQNVTLLQCNLDYFVGGFDIGVSLHACGVATDLVIEHCLRRNVAFVSCPCCYGGVHVCHHISYPRSKIFRDSFLSLRDYLILGHAADQTHDSENAKTKQGIECMNVIDTDRKLHAEECGYEVYLSKMIPESCTPKNNLLVGLPSKM